jgi:hypothetical protein
MEIARIVGVILLAVAVVTTVLLAVLGGSVWKVAILSVAVAGCLILLIASKLSH